MTGLPGRRASDVAYACLLDRIRGGSVVTSLGLEDALDLFDAREAIECGVAAVLVVLSACLPRPRVLASPQRSPC